MSNSELLAAAITNDVENCGLDSLVELGVVCFDTRDSLAVDLQLEVESISVTVR